LLPPFVYSAIVYASLFAFMALGLTLTYITTKVPNFAYGSFVTVGLYTAFTLIKVYGINPYEASPLAFVLGSAVAVAMYLGVLRPLARRGSSLVSLMIATFGVDVGFIGIFGIYTDYLQTKYGLPDAKQFFQFQTDFSIFGLRGMVLVAPLALAITTLVLYLLLTRTKFGVAMRASVENPPLARILGINVERVYVVSWFLAGGFAGLAGCLYTLWLPGGTSTGSNLIVEIFASSILGGLTSIFGAVLGGLAIGGSEVGVGTDLTTGFGVVGAIVIAGIFVLAGLYVWRRKETTKKLLSLFFLGLGAYIILDIALGYPLDFLAPGLVSGFGADAIEYQKGIPLLVMVATLLVLPKGLVSLDWRRFLRRSRKT
jgi:branched-chain amino acid transport system permease protein